MGKTKKNQIRVSFIGGNADGVTGSMTLVESQDFKILLECGLVQSNNIKADYYANSRKLPFKAKEFNAIFIGHSHIDHIGLIPRLVAEGFSGRIIAPKGTHKLFLNCTPSSRQRNKIKYLASKGVSLWMLFSCS